MTARNVPNGDLGVTAALAANTVDTVTFLLGDPSVPGWGPPIAQVEILSDATADIYLTIDGSTPTVGGTNTHRVPAGTDNLVLAIPAAGRTVATTQPVVVKLISAGTPTYSVSRETGVRESLTGSNLSGDVSLVTGHKLTLPSSAAGGGNTSDSTGRLNLQSHQRAVNPNHFGEVIRVDLEEDDAKAMIAWRENYTGSGPRSVAWIGAHGKSNDGLSWHNHISIEVPDETGALQTALEVPFAAWNQADGFGIAAADVYVRAVATLIAGGVPISIEGPAATNRELHFGTVDGTNVGGKTAFRRWSVRQDNTAEGGSSAGSDFRIVRRDDTGAVLDTAVFIKRSTGLIGIAGNVSPAANVDVGAGTATVSARVNRGASASTFASVVLATAGTDRWSFQLRNDSTDDLHIRNAAQAHDAILVENRATAPNIQLLSSTKAFGGGVGVVGITNASTVPASNPTGGGVLYSESGALKWRGSSGTVTTLAAA